MYRKLWLRACVQSMGGRAEAVTGSDAVPPVGEAVQARQGRREAERGEGAGVVLERGGTRVDAGDGGCGVGVLGDGEKGGGDEFVWESGGVG